MATKAKSKALTPHQAATYARYMEVVSMLEAGMTHREIEELTHTSKSKIGEINRGLKEGKYPAPDQYVEQLREVGRGRIARIKANLLKSLEEKSSDPETVAKTSMRDMSVTYGIMDDKDRLERGEPTSIVRTERALSNEDLFRQAALAAQQIQSKVADLKARGIYDDAIEAEFSEVEDS